MQSLGALLAVPFLVSPPFAAALDTRRSLLIPHVFADTDLALTANILFQSSLFASLLISWQLRGGITIQIQLELLVPHL